MDYGLQIPFQLDATPSSGQWNDFFSNSLHYPALVSSACLAFQIFLAGRKVVNRLRLTRKDSRAPNDVLNPFLNDSTWLQKHGDRVIVGFMLGRLTGCVSLVILSLTTLLRCQHANHEHKASILEQIFRCPEIYMTATFAYCTFLACLSLAIPSRNHKAASLNVVVLFAGFTTYLYRDVWPLATYTMPQVDASEGTLLWVKICILFFIAVVVPLFSPRRYIPVDPKEPMEIPNPEQTCSIFSLVVYSFMSPIIHHGARVPHLLPKDLPPSSDTDLAKNLKKNSFPQLDMFSGAKNRHIFFGLLYTFRTEFIRNTFGLIGQALCNMAAPIGINRILAYLEGGKQDMMRPWFWVLWIFLGPAMDKLLLQWYIFISMRTLTRAEGLLTQLVFEHSLRIRLSSESAQHQGDAPDGTAPKPKEPQSANLIGKINNLVTSDLGNIVGGRDILVLVVFAPAQIILCILFLYKILGWSSFVGLGVTILLFPIPGMIVKNIQDEQRKRMAFTDARVQDVSEGMSVLRMIKLFGWEKQVSDRIQDKRNKELKHLGRLKMLQAFNDMINSLIPRLAMLATYATYTLVMRQELDASKIFSSISVFSLLGLQLHRLSLQSTLAAQARVSLDRMNDFLHNTELLDSFKSKSSDSVILSTSVREDERIGFDDALFSWSEGNVPANRAFKLKISGQMLFKPNCINMIIGPTGSGKTSLLMSLLGEMYFSPVGPDSWFNLPRAQGVSYAAQESWIQNDTIRNNILFGSLYEEERYQKVIKQCALERDLGLFEAGDQTEVGEKGLTLSGGQKARVTLARAVYSHTKIVLLDDILAALDVHTAAWIVKYCLQGDLLRDRTVLLVTHNVALVGPIAGFVVSLGQEGTIVYHGTDVSEAVPNLQALADVEKSEEKYDVGVQEEGVSATTKSTVKTDGKLVVEEEVAQGHITRKSFNLFFSALGGKHPVAFFVVWIGGFFLADWLLLLQRWFLGYWSTQYETHHPSEVSVTFYLSVFFIMLVTSLLVSSGTSFFFVSGVLRASRKIHTMLVTSIFSSTFRWLDMTPTARIIARCTQDMHIIDGPLNSSFAALVDVLVCMITRMLLVIIFTPAFLVPAIGVVAAGAYLGNLFLKAQMSVKREMSNARSPVLSHISAAITGIVSVRAYGAQVPFRLESLKRIDHYIRISRTSYNLDRWIGIRSDLIAATFNASLAAYLVYFRSIGAANTGFLLNVSVDLCGLILWAVRLFNDVEVQSNSLERVQDYLTIEHEAPATESGKPPAAWPTSGDLVVKNLTARYSKNGPPVLRDISFHIKSGERIGIVGRTGSGKTSLTLALLRCILTEGTIYLDGIATDSINLDALRSNITIIPQAPELLSGTLRRNLEPFEQHDDVTLNDALRAAGLFSIQDDSGEDRITLDSNVSSGGGNLSVGQRQIISLARAMVRGSKLLIMDEATSAIDYRTDAAIQHTLRHELSQETTVITIAHRLQTIMDADRIMVLDEGRIVEFDSPQVLLSYSNGVLKSFVDGNKDKAALYSTGSGETDALSL